LGLISGLCVLSVAPLAQAQCTKDTDCKGDRVCEGGACTSPVPPPVVAAPSTVAAPAEPTPPTVTEATKAAPAPPVAAASPSTAPVEPALDESRYATDGARGGAYSREDDERVDARPLKPRRHSTAMMVGGIVMVSVSPIALLASLVASLQQDGCEAGNGFGFDGTQGFDEPFSNCDRYDKTIYGGLILGVGLIGAGIPMIVIGAKRETATARVSPWATQSAAGLRLQLDL
jgi:hypothetical protein